MKQMKPYHIRWAPALLDADLHAQLVKSAPRGGDGDSGETDRHKFTGKVIGDLTDSIVRMAASQIDLPPTLRAFHRKKMLGK